VKVSESDSNPRFARRIVASETKSQRKYMTSPVGDSNDTHPSVTADLGESMGSQTLGVACPECRLNYARVRGVRRHSILAHGKRFDVDRGILVPFGTQGELDQAQARCCWAQMSSHRRRQKHSRQC